MMVKQMKMAAIMVSKFIISIVLYDHPIRTFCFDYFLIASLGKGKAVMDNECVYEGNFQNGLFHGRGELFSNQRIAKCNIFISRKILLA
jgi:hypothetical protein